jgi:hypothetical protein
MKRALPSIVLGVQSWTSRRWLSGLAVALGAGMGCGEPGIVQDAAPETGKNAQALAGYGTGEWAGPVHYWDQNNYEVPVCYLENEDNTGSDAAYFGDFVDALAEVEAIAGLSFHWDGPCAGISPPELAAYVPVIFDDQWSGGRAAPGFGKRRIDDQFPVEYQVAVGVLSRFELNSVHEMLHALGFLHEQQRSDSLATCSAALANNGNNTPEPGADRLTPYDDESVMNYCRTSSNGQLTYFDRVGLSVVYPMTFTRAIQVDLALRTGSGLISRTQGNVYPDWLRDGALDSVVTSLTWTASGSPVATGPHLSLSGFSSGTTLALSGWFWDFLGRAHSIAPSTLTIDNAKHTALVLTALL